MQLTNREMGNYLKNLRISLNLSTYDVNKICDISPSYLSLVENGHRRASAGILKKLSPIYNVDYLDLYVKAGYADLAEYEKKNKVDKLGNPVVTIPLLGEIKAGYNYLAQENWIGTEEISPELANSGEFYALKVKGDSMADSILDGDIAIIKKQDVFEDNKISVVIINGDEGTLKLVKILDNGIKLMPLNRRINPETNEPFYEDLFFVKEEIKAKPVLMAGKLVDLKRHYE